MPVEAFALERHLGRTRTVPPTPREGFCTLLDEDDRCVAYEARPVLCRTHGLPLRQAGGQAGALPILGDDVFACSLNFTERKPEPEDVLDATTILALLGAVNESFLRKVWLDEDRVPIAAIAAAYRPPSTDGSNEAATTSEAER